MLFVSVEQSAGVIEAALAAGGQGYMAKTEVAAKLLVAIDAVLHS